MSWFTHTPLRQALVSSTVIAVGLLCLLGVFRWYVHPDFMLGLADMVWGCF